MLVGVDIGGTFTDLVLSMAGRLHVHKVLSTPHDPAEALLAGLADLDLGPALRMVIHSSTIATNAILERRGAPTALITTQGFRDVLTIGRQDRPDLYALHPILPPPLIPDRWCYEVPERTDHTGAILKPLGMTALDRILDEIAVQDVQSVAVCLLHSYANPTHERAVRARILERGLFRHWQVVLSCEVLPEFREYERACATAMEAYVRPLVARYLQRIEDELRPARTLGPPTLLTPSPMPMFPLLRVIKADGGVMSVQQAQQRAICTALSGPTAGVGGGFHLAQLAGYAHVITLDVGGTSTDVALCPGELVCHSQSQIDGLPLSLRTLDVETIGVGGGAIAYLDAGGLLCVGPESAGADPGPICYGRGGQRVTLTDAHLALGRLDEDHPLGGVLALAPEPARAAIAELASAMGLETAVTAQGIVDVANVTIEGAVRRLSTVRGHDPHDFTLVAFG
ncbi:MAG TPA: hydantoinase/oxoprolinase family protein, partial [Chloroflexi bacterium]|nr:hydantoinase/oxoprolinase family protein [Chloroflexota bacterium]